MRTCGVEGCEDKQRAKGWCNRHYLRWRNHGDPLAGGPRRLRGHSLADRFWAKVRKTDSCWNWEGHVSVHGYGKFWTDTQNQPAHRVAYKLVHGELSDDMPIHHKCRNRKCVNPDHLVEVTDAANTLEALAYKADHAQCYSMTHYLSKLDEIIAQGP